LFALAFGAPTAVLLACSLTTSLDGLTGGAPPSFDAAQETPAPTPGSDTGPSPTDAAQDAGAPDACALEAQALQADPRNCGACGRDCLGGACVGARCQPVQLATGQGVSRGLLVDATHVYWASRTNGTVVRVLKTGGDVETIVAGLDQPADIAVRLALSAAGARVDSIVWLASGNGQVGLISADGGGARTVTTATLGAGGARNGRVALSPFALYYSNTSVDRVVRVDLVSGSETDVATAENNAFGLAAGTAGGERIYWTADKPDAAGGAYSALPNGGGRLTLAAGQSTPRTLALAQGPRPADVDRVAWVTAIPDGGVYRAEVSADGGVVGPILLARANEPWAVVDHAVHGVYFTSSATPGGVFRCPPSGCGDASPEVVAAGLVQPTYLALDDLAVYVSAADGNVYRIAR